MIAGDPIVSFFVPCVPQTWKRPQQAKNGRVRYTDTGNRALKKSIRFVAWAAVVQAGVRHWAVDSESAFSVEVTSYVARDVGDVDNLAKLVLDALNGIAYADDRRVTSLLAERVSATRTSHPTGYQVTVSRTAAR